MSKSLPPAPAASDLLDDPAVIAKKIRSAVTDTGREVVADPENKPGVTNLLTILSALSGPIGRRARGALRRPRLRRPQEGARRGRHRRSSRRSAQRTHELLADPAELEPGPGRRCGRAREVAARHAGRGLRPGRLPRPAAVARVNDDTFVRAAAAAPETTVLGIVVPVPEPWAQLLVDWRGEGRRPPGRAWSRRTSRCCRPTEVPSPTARRSAGTCAGWPRAHAPFDMHLRGTGTFRPGLRRWSSSRWRAASATAS